MTYYDFFNKYISFLDGPGPKRVHHITWELEKMKFYKVGNIQKRQKYLLRKKIDYLKMNYKYYKGDEEGIIGSIIDLYRIIVQDILCIKNISAIQINTFFGDHYDVFHRDIQEWIAINNPEENMDHVEEEAMYESLHYRFENYDGVVDDFNFADMIFEEFREYMHTIFYEWVICELFKVILDREYFKSVDDNFN